MSQISFYCWYLPYLCCIFQPKNKGKSNQSEFSFRLRMPPHPIFFHQHLLALTRLMLVSLLRQNVKDVNEKKMKKHNKFYCLHHLNFFRLFTLIHESFIYIFLHHSNSDGVLLGIEMLKKTHSGKRRTHFFFAVYILEYSLTIRILCIHLCSSK